MKLISAATAFWLLNLSTAAPSPAPATNGAIVARDGNGATCSLNSQDDLLNFSVSAWGPWADDWGQGFLDNLRGQCGEQIFNWQFGYTDNVGNAQFSTTLFIPDGCVENAIWLASDPTGAIWGVSCSVS
jgi:hypothetical protein